MNIRPGDIIAIPSPIDVHTHLREPGGREKETIATGTMAALAGGFQAVFDMPNNPQGMQTWTEERLDTKIDIATHTAKTNIGFYAGVDLSNPNIDEIPRMIGKAAGLKLYLGHTTGNIREFGLDEARSAIDAWVSAGREKNTYAPILLHAREGVGEEVARYIARKSWKVHWCHIASKTEVDMADDLRKSFGDTFTAGVTPHHLTMTSRDADLKYGWNGGRMMPELGDEADGDALLDAFANGRIQILETDHAPHTTKEKMAAERANPEGHTHTDCVTCFGISGIEFVLPVMMSLVMRKKLTISRLEDALYFQPLHMLGLVRPSAHQEARTFMEIEPHVIGEDDRVSMSSNNPYIGWTGWAKVHTVEMNGATYFRNQAYPPVFKPKILKQGMVA